MKYNEHYEKKSKISDIVKMSETVNLLVYRQNTKDIDLNH